MDEDEEEEKEEDDEDDEYDMPQRVFAVLAPPVFVSCSRSLPPILSVRLSVYLSLSLN